MPTFFMLDRRAGNIAYIRKDGDQFTLVSRTGRETFTSRALDPNQFPMTEVSEGFALSQVRPDKHSRPIATAVETKTGTLSVNPASSLTNQDIDDLAAAIDDAIRKGRLATTNDIRDLITKTLSKAPAVSPNP